MREMELARHLGRLDRVPAPPAEAADLFPDYSANVQRALHEWTAKVDNKASVVLTLETAVFGAVLAFSSAAKPLAHLDGPILWSYRAGICLLVGAILCAGAAVFPQLNRRDARRNWTSNYLYFGHIRRWRPNDLVTAVQSDRAERGHLVTSTQIVALSKIVWRKHVFLQWSMTLALVGGICVGAAAMLH
jgi:Family of unknown function (DUF5706)